MTARCTVTGCEQPATHDADVLGCHRHYCQPHWRDVMLWLVLGTAPADR